MNVTGKTKIFRKDFNGKPAYSRCIASKKYENGQQIDEWIREYESVQFPRDTDIADKTEVEITDAFETVYQKKDGTIARKLVVRSYRPTTQGFENININDCPF